MIVTLIGYRGSGKTSVGRELAMSLGLAFVDADVVLEERAGKTIKQIFAEGGEPAFRDWEENVLKDLLLTEDTIVAAGGGAILRSTNRQRMKAAGPVVWLQAAPERLYERITADTTTADRRPNLTAQGGIDEIRHLLNQREPLYRECADQMVCTTGKTPDQVTGEIVSFLQAGLHDVPSSSS